PHPGSDGIFDRDRDCKYHVVFVPKYRRKVLYGEIRKHLGKIFHELAKEKECQIIEGHLMLDHVHMCIAVPPKHSVASVIGFIKGKSAIAIARMQGKERNFAGEHFWARGCGGLDRWFQRRRDSPLHSRPARL